MYELALCKLSAVMIIDRVFGIILEGFYSLGLEKKAYFSGTNPSFMKKQLSFLFVVVAANFFIYSSCNKTDYTPPTPKTKTQLLTQGSWKFKSATANGADASGFLQACQKDNIYTFVAAGTGTA